MLTTANLAESLVRLEGSNEKAALRLGVSTATIVRWRTGKSTPQPAQEQKLRRCLSEGADSDLFNRREGGVVDEEFYSDLQIENVVRSLLTDFREILHRHAKFSHRNDSLDFLAKILFSHITDKENGGDGISSVLLSRSESPSLRLKSFVEMQLRTLLPETLAHEIDTLSKTLFLSEKDDAFSLEVIELFNADLVNKVLSGVIRSQRLDIINNIFGRFVTDSFVEEKEMGQYLTPPEVVRLMAELGASSLPNDIRPSVS